MINAAYHHRKLLNINIMYKIYSKEGRGFFFPQHTVSELSVLSQLVKSYRKRFFFFLSGNCNNFGDLSIYTSFSNLYSPH